MIYIPPKLLGYGLVLLAVAVVAGTLYGCGRKDKADDSSLKVAREVIKTEREALKITHRIDMRVNAEGIQTATKAQEADREIERIRTNRVLPSTADNAMPEPAGENRADCDAACTRVLQLAREARAAALESSAKLQPARTSAR